MRRNFWLAGLFRHFTTRTVRTGLRRPPSAGTSAIVEVLENRQLLSAGTVAQMLPDGPAVQVNTFTTASQFVPSIAMDAAGDYVVVWQSTNQEGSSADIGIFAQRYNAQGVAVGGEIHVNTTTTFSDTSPSVAMDTAGDFVVTWTSNGQDGSRYGIYAQRFAANGNAEGTEFRVNTSTLFSQTGGSVGMDSAGDFIVTWQSYTQQGGNAQIYAQRYNAAGTAVGTQFQVNTDTTQGHFAGTASMDAAGDFLITWRDSTTQGTFGQRFSAGGIKEGAVIKFDSGLGESTVAMNAAGDFVVAFEKSDGSDYGIFAQRYSASGVAEGSAFQVNTYTTGAQRFPTVAIDSNGDFVIAWQNFTNEQAGLAEGVHAQRFDSTGTPQGTEFEVAQGSGGQFLVLPDVAIDSAGDFVVTWQGFNRSGGNQYDVYAQRYHADVAPVLSQIETSTLIDNGTFAIPITSSVVASDIDNTTLAGGTIKIAGNYQNGQDQLIFVNTANITGSWNVSTGVLTLAGTDSIAAYQAALRSVKFQTTGLNTAARTISFQVSDGQQNSAAVSRKVDLPPTFAVTPVTVNPAIGSTVQFRVTFSEPVGNVVVGDFSLIENGLAGGTIQLAGVDSIYTVTISGLEGHGTLELDLTNFSSIVDAGHNPVIFGSNGSALTVNVPGPTVTAVFAGTGPHQLQNGGELTASVTAFSLAFSENVNSTTRAANSVTNPSNWQLTRYGVDVSSLISGITYGLNTTTHQYTAVVHFSQLLSDGGYQLVARQAIHDLAGSALNSKANGAGGSDFQFDVVIANVVAAGTEIRVNTITGGNQTQPAIAMDAKGDYVAVWSSYLEDGSGYGVYAQRYSSTGAAIGGEFRVNTYTKGAQESPSVAMDDLGDFVIAWQSFGQDGSGWGIYAQRYDSSGIAQGGEFRVNTITSNSQFNASVAMDAGGDFVIAWSQNQTASQFNDNAQRYNSLGVAQGGNFSVNTGVNDGSYVVHAAMDSTGAFIISYSNHLRRYSATGAALGNAITVANQVHETAVAMDAEGDFVVAWSNSAFGGGSSVIFAQRYDSTGLAEGPFLVTGLTTINQQLPSVAMDAAGDFVVAWHSYGYLSSLVGYYAKRYGSDGTSQGSEFKFDSNFTLSIGNPPAVAMDSAGDFVASWKSVDGSGTGIFLHRYQADVAPFLSQVESSVLTETPTLAVPVTGSLQALDLDSVNLTGATIRIAGNYQNGQDVLAFIGASTPKISASWDASTGTLTLSGNDTVSDYQTALRNVTFRNSGGSPSSTLIREIDFQVTDGLLSSNTVSRDVMVLGLPTLSGVNPIANYDTSNGTPIAIAPTLVATDPNSVNLVSATISISGWRNEDRLSVGSLFGLNSTFTQNLAAHTASLTITGIDTIAHFQAMLRSIKYSDVSNHPDHSTRVATIVVSDGVFVSNSVNVSIQLPVSIVTF